MSLSDFLVASLLVLLSIIFLPVILGLMVSGFVFFVTLGLVITLFMGVIYGAALVVGYVIDGLKWTKNLVARKPV